jgi:hypothetical protein
VGRRAPGRHRGRGRRLSEPLRRAGAGGLADGSRVVWSVAEGRRGRRWREVRTAPDGGVLSSLLLETDPDGRFSHTELATPAGLLTLHPEGDGTLHGNTIGSDGVRHVVGLPWDADGLVVVEGSPVAAAAAAQLARADSGSATRRVLRVALDLRSRVETTEAAGLGLAADADGLPLLVDARSWPLEGE